MWKPLFCCLLVAGVTTVSAWNPNERYEFTVRSRALTALHQVSNQYTGLLVKANLAIEPDTREDLRVKISDALYAEVNMEMPQGWDQEIPDRNLRWHVLPTTNSSLKIQLQNGLVKRVLVTNTTKEWDANFLKGILSTLQVNVRGERLVKERQSSPPEINSRNALYKTMESSVTGECEVQYVISPLSEVSLLLHPELAPLRKTSDRLLDINKVQDFQHCNKRRALNFGFTGIDNFEPGQNKMGQFLARTSMSRVIVSGTLNNFTIQSSVTTNKVIVSPEMYNNQKGLIVSRVNVTLKSIRRQTKMPEILNPIDVGDLVYRYNGPSGKTPLQPNEYNRAVSLDRDSSARTSSNDKSMGPEEKKRSNFEQSRWIHRLHYLEKVLSNVINRESSNTSWGKQLNSEVLFQLPTEDGESPNIPLLPLFVGNEGNSVIIPGGVEPVKTVYKLSVQIATDIMDPQTLPEQNTLARFILLTRLIRTLNLNHLIESTRRLYTKDSPSSTQLKRSLSIKIRAWKVFRDAVAEAGTEPALLAVKDWIQSGKIGNESAAEVVAVLPRTALIPTPRYLEHLFGLVKDNKTMEQSELHEATVLSFARLLRVAAVDGRSRHQYYPTHVFDKIVTKHFPPIRQTYIPFFGSFLKEAVRDRNSIKIQLYIRALAEVAHPDILRYLEPYLQDQHLVSEYQRTLIVISLSGVTQLHPDIVRPLLIKLYENTGESHRVRCAAVQLMMITNPPAEVLQRMAEFTNVDPSKHVISAVQTAIRNAVQLKGPMTLELARNAKAAVHLLNPVDLGAAFSNAWLQSRMVKDHDMGYVMFAGYTGSTDSIFPNAGFLKLIRNLGGSLNKHVNVAALVSSVRETLNFLERKLKLNVGERQIFSETNVEDLLNIVPDRGDPVEGVFKFKFAGGERIFTFDNNTLDKIPEVVKRLLQKYETLRSFDFTKLHNVAGMTLAFPNALGFPALYTVNVPVAMLASGRSQLSTRQDRGVPAVLNLTADIHLAFSMRKLSNIGFVSPFNVRKYVAAVERNFLVNIPLSTTINVDVRKKSVTVLVRPRDSRHSQKLVQWNTVPYTTQHDILSMQPLLEDSDAKLIHVLPPKKIKKTFGEKTTGVRFVIEGHSEQEFVDKKWLLQNLRPYDFLSRIQFFWASQAIQNNNITLSHDVRGSRSQLINITVGYAESRLTTVHDVSEDEESVEERRSQHLDSDDVPNKANLFTAESTSNREERDFLAKARTLGNFHTRVLVSTVQFVGQQTAELQIRGRLASSEVDGSAISMLSLRFRPHVGVVGSEYRAFLSADLTVPQVPLVNFHDALKFEPRSTVKAILFLGDVTGRWATIALDGDLEQSAELRREIAQSPMAKLCEGQMKAKNHLLPACRNVTELSSRLDKYHFTVTYENLDDYWINATYNTYAILRRCGAAYVTENFLNTRQRHGVVDVDVRIDAAGDAFSVFVDAPLMDIKLTDVRLSKWTRPLVQLSPGQTVLDRLGSVALPLYYNPTCVLDHSAVNTFDNKTYPLELDQRWHVMMVRVPKIPADVGNPRDWRRSRQRSNETVEVLVRQSAQGQRVVQVNLARSTYNLRLKLYQLQPLFVEVNGKAVQVWPRNVSHVVLNDISVARLKILPGGSLNIHFPQDKLDLIYDGERVLLQASNVYRDEVRGLCGTFDTDPTTDFTVPQNCIVRDPVTFVKSYALPNSSEEASDVSDANGEACVDLKVVTVDLISKQLSRNPVSRGFDLIHPVNDSSSSSSEYTLNSDWEDSLHSSSSSSSKKPSRRLETRNSSMSHHTLIVNEETEICFSKRPLPVCDPLFKPTETLRKKITLHCLPKGTTANRWTTMVKQGVNPDFSKKEGHRQIEIDIPTKCVRL